MSWWIWFLSTAVCLVIGIGGLLGDNMRLRRLVRWWMERTRDSEEKFAKAMDDLRAAIASLETAKGMLAPLRAESDSRRRMLERAKSALEAIIEEEKQGGA